MAWPARKLSADTDRPGSLNHLVGGASMPRPKPDLLWAYFDDPRGELWRANIRTRLSRVLAWLTTRLLDLRPNPWPVDPATGRPVKIPPAPLVAEWPAEWTDVVSTDGGAVQAAVAVHRCNDDSTFCGLKLPGAGLGESEFEYAVCANIVALRDDETEVEIDAGNWVDGESFLWFLWDICETWPEVATQWGYRSEQATSDAGGPFRPMRFVVLKPFNGLGRDWKPGDVVEITSPRELGRWRNLPALERTGYLREWPPGEPTAAARPGQHGATVTVASIRGDDEPFLMDGAPLVLPIVRPLAVSVEEAEAAISRFHAHYPKRYGIQPPQLMTALIEGAPGRPTYLYLGAEDELTITLSKGGGQASIRVAGGLGGVSVEVATFITRCLAMFAESGLLEGSTRGQAEQGNSDSGACNPACVRWRQQVAAYLKRLSPDEEPTLEGLAGYLFLAHDTVKRRSSQHMRCCLDWRTVKRTRELPGWGTSSHLPPP